MAGVSSRSTQGFNGARLLKVTRTRVALKNQFSNLTGCLTVSTYGSRSLPRATPVLVLPGVVLTTIVDSVLQNHIGRLFGYHNGRSIGIA